MLINKIRLLVQAFSFLILTYGGRIGINLCFALLCLPLCCRLWWLLFSDVFTKSWNLRYCSL